MDAHDCLRVALYRESFYLGFCGSRALEQGENKSQALVCGGDPKKYAILSRRFFSLDLLPHLCQQESLRTPRKHFSLTFQYIVYNFLVYHFALDCILHVFFTIQRIPHFLFAWPKIRDIITANFLAKNSQLRPLLHRQESL